MTGDTLGALNEIVEVAVLVVMVSVSFMHGGL
jgi:cobalamin synthase